MTHLPCTDDPELFFDQPQRDNEARQARAKAMCRRCPAEAACLAHALTWAEEGVWGGTTEKERKGIAELTGRHPQTVPLGLPRGLVYGTNPTREAS